MQQQEQREEWIRRHTWGATKMDQHDQRETSPEDDQATSGAGGALLEDEETPPHTQLPPPPTPRIVEGTLVESSLLVPAPLRPSPAQAERTRHPAHALLRWVGRPLMTVLVALLSVLLLTPTQPRVMRLFVSMLPAGVVVPPTSHHPAQIEARLLATPLLTQQVTVPTTGRGHQPATQGHGLVTFYNQAPTAQTIPSGMLLSGADGVQVVTDQAVAVPAAHLPAQGQLSVTAHALPTGPQGNIGANDLDGLCCFAGIAVQNAQAFVGGQHARDFPAVGAQDVRSAAAPLVTTLSSQGQAAVQAQVRAAEQLVHPVQCAPQVRATPAVGAEATQVTVAVRVTCQAEVYNADEMQARVGALLGQEATTNLAPGYTRQGEVTATLSSTTTVVARSGIVAFHVQAEGVWAYHLSAAQLHALTTLVAGQPFQEARAILLHAQGIHQVTITSTAWWDDAGQQTLPADPNRIQVVDFSWVGMESRKEEASKP
jgi:hypothetical protein